jgi:hypothetical protein
MQCGKVQADSRNRAEEASFKAAPKPGKAAALLYASNEVSIAVGNNRMNKLERLESMKAEVRTLVLV